MYYYLEGRLFLPDYQTAVIDCGGVGYKLTVSATTRQQISPRNGQTVRLYTYLSVREDAMELFGFATEEEKAAYELLIGVSGMTSGIGALFGHQLFGWDYVFDWEVLRDGWNDFTQEVPEVVSLISSGFFKVTALLVFFLPFIGMTYAGIMMIFDFKSPSWRPGLVIFLVWVVSLVVLAIISIMGFAGHVF